MLKLNFAAIILTLFLLLLPGDIIPQHHPAVEEKRIVQTIEKLFKDKKYRESLDLVEKNRNAYPYSISFSYWRALNMLYLPVNGLSERNKNYGIAASELEKIMPYIESNPYFKDNRKMIYFHAAMAFGLGANYKRAVSYLKKAVDTDSRFAEAWFNLGVYYYKLHNNVESERSFQMYLDIVNSKEEIF